MKVKDGAVKVSNIVCHNNMVQVGEGIEPKVELKHVKCVLISDGWSNLIWNLMVTSGMRDISWYIDDERIRTNCKCAGVTILNLNQLCQGLPSFIMHSKIIYH